MRNHVVVLLLAAITTATTTTFCTAFVPVITPKACCLPRDVSNAQQTAPLLLQMSSSSSSSDEQDLIRRSKASRQASADDRVVELKRPLGLVLNEDDSGNVYVETVAPRGNAARTGKVKEGDVVTMCSATFGDQMWSCRGVGLDRVLSAIRVRSGPTVKLVFESPQESVKKARQSAKATKAAKEAQERAQAKRDDLLKELEQDEKKLKKGKFFGLF